MIHQINIFIHVAAGTIALATGILLLLGRKGTFFHRKTGSLFVWLLGVVVTTGFFGWLFFRSDSFLLMLTILAGYNTFSGYRIVLRKERQATLLDLIAAFLTLTTALIYLSYLMTTHGNWAPSVIYPTVSGIVVVTGYDIIKQLMLFNRLRSWWLYEHIYKIVSAFSAILSAFVGTILPNFKPYSQIGPSTLCLLLIAMFVFRVASRLRSATDLRPQP